MSRCSRILFAAAFLPACLLLAADEAAPKAEDIVDKYIQVTGGKAAYEKYKTEVATGTFEVVTMGLSGEMKSYKAAPDKTYLRIELGGMAIEQGVSGGVAWSSSPMEGTRIKDGPERAMAMREATFNSELHWRDFFKSVELAGTDTVDGKACYKLTMTPKEGNPETRYYEKESGLLTKMSMTVRSPQGETPIDLKFSDYRDEGGILTPHTVGQKLPEQEFRVTMSTVKRGEEIPPERFTLPDEVKKLISEKK